MRKRGLAYIGTCLITLLISRQGAADSSPLMVRVYNFSHADDQVISQAESIARGIFHEVGIESEWGPARDPHKLDPSTLTVQIFAARSTRSDMKDAFGAALVAKRQSESFLANVFFGNIEEKATTRKDAAILLGHVMAHEVGHLLLGTGHASGTIMAEGLGSKDLHLIEAGRVRFNPRQVERLRWAVAARESSRSSRARIMRRSGDAASAASPRTGSPSIRVITSLASLLDRGTREHTHPPLPRLQQARCSTRRHA